MYKVVVPATSANLGSGFDCAGIALNVYNTVYIDRADELQIETLDSSVVPTDESNLIFQAAKSLCRQLGKPELAFVIKQINEIPMTRGLGSSAACIVAGLFGANAVLGNPATERELLELAVKMDGHPDNVAPAILGGAVVSAMGERRLYYSRFDIANDLNAAAFIPPYPLETAYARSCMPKNVSLADAVYNLSRSAILTAAFANRDYTLFAEACNDRIHQPYRLALIAGARDVMEISNGLGAYATFISGAGSTMLSFANASNSEYWSNIEKAIQNQQSTADFAVKRLKADNTGVQVIHCDD